MPEKFETLQNKLLLKGVNFQVVDSKKIVVDFPYTMASKSFSIKFIPAVLMVGLGLFLVNILANLGSSGSNDAMGAFVQLLLLLFLGLPALLLGFAFFAFGGTAFVVALFSGPRSKKDLTGRVIVADVDGEISLESDNNEAKAEMEKFLTTIFSSSAPIQ